MRFAEDNDQLLLTYFREFYSQVGQLEQAISANQAGFVPRLDGESSALDGGTVSQSLQVSGTQQSNAIAERTGAPTPDQSTTCAAIQQSLIFFFEQQTRRAQNDGCQFYERAKYVMVALADEKFINLKWPGRSEWIESLLESKLFQSHAAGQEFYIRLDRLLQERDPGYRELACVYLMALSLGFRGKLDDFRDRQRLAEYRRELFLFVFHRSPVTERLPHLFPQSYAHTLRGRRRGRLPRVKLWITALCLAILTYIGVSHRLWTNLVKPLNELNIDISKIVGELNGR